MIRINSTEHKTLKKISAKYSLSFADIIGELVNDVEGLDNFVMKHWKVCPYCNSGNDINVEKCENCLTSLKA